MKIGNWILEDMLQELDGIIVIETGRREACTSEAMTPVDLNGDINRLDVNNGDASPHS